MPRVAIKADFPHFFSRPAINIPLQFLPGLNGPCKGKDLEPSCRWHLVDGLRLQSDLPLASFNSDQRILNWMALLWPASIVQGMSENFLGCTFELKHMEKYVKRNYIKFVLFDLQCEGQIQNDRKHADIWTKSIQASSPWRATGSHQIVQKDLGRSCQWLQPCLRHQQMKDFSNTGAIFERCIRVPFCRQVFAGNLK